MLNKTFIRNVLQDTLSRKVYDRSKSLNQEELVEVMSEALEQCFSELYEDLTNELKISSRL